MYQYLIDFLIYLRARFHLQLQFKQGLRTPTSSTDFSKSFAPIVPQIGQRNGRITRSWSDYVSRERQPGDCISRVTQIRLTSPESSKPDNLFKNKITQPLTSPEFPESDHVPPELPKPDHLNIPRVNITRPSQHPPSKHNQTFCACPEYPNQTFCARPEYPNQTFCACPEYPKPDFLCTSRVSKTRLSFYVPIIRNQTFCACHEYTTNYRRNSGGTL